MSVDYLFAHIPRAVNVVYPLSADEPKPNLIRPSKDKDGNKPPDYYVRVKTLTGITVGHMYFDEEDKPDIDLQIRAFVDVLTIRLEHHDGDPFGDVPF